MSDDPRPAPPNTRPRWGGAAIAAATSAAMFALVVTGPRSFDVGAIGLVLGTCVAIVWSWQSSTARTVALALVALAMFAARLQSVAQGLTQLRPLSAAQHEDPTLETRGDETWLVHPLDFEMRVPPGTQLYESEATLRAGRYATLADDLTPTSWIAPAVQWDVDVVAAHAEHVAEADAARAFDDVVRTSLAAMETAGAHYERREVRGPRDQWVWLAIEGGTMATRFVMLDLPDGELFVTVNARGDVEASIPLIDTLQLRR